MDFWELVWSLLIAFVLLAYLILLFDIIRDVLTDRSLSGVKKVTWLILLIWLPIFTALVYVVARGGTRDHPDALDSRGAPAHGGGAARTASRSATDEIARAKTMWDNGVIDEAEFAALKQKAIW
jgi:hypothetical protein